MTAKNAPAARGGPRGGRSKAPERELRAVLIRVNYDGLKALRQLALDRDRTVQSLGIEAFNDVLRKYGAKPVLVNPLLEAKGE
jgi:hypothetical protein